MYEVSTFLEDNLNHLQDLYHRLQQTRIVHCRHNCNQHGKHSNTFCITTALYQCYCSTALYLCYCYSVVALALHWCRRISGSQASEYALKVSSWPFQLESLGFSKVRSQIYITLTLGVAFHKVNLPQVIIAIAALKSPLSLFHFESLSIAKHNAEFLLCYFSAWHFVGENEHKI